MRGDGARLLERPDWQRLWLGTRRRLWRTLAVVPADAWVSSFEVAAVLVAMGRHYGERVDLADLRSIEFRHTRAFLSLLKGNESHSEHLVLALASLHDSSAAAPIAREVDGVVLCASMGQSALTSIKETIEQIGKDRFLGSVLLRARSAPS